MSKKIGRPAKYPTPEKMQAAIDDYFAACEAGKERTWIDKRGQHRCETIQVTPSIAGLALHLGFSSRQSVSEQKGRGKGFADVILRARLRIDSEWVSAAAEGRADAQISRLVLSSDHGYTQTDSAVVEIGKATVEAVLQAMQVSRASKSVPNSPPSDVSRETSEDDGQ